MKICYLAAAWSVHTHRWVRHFARRGYQVTLVSFHPGKLDWKGIHVFQLPTPFSRPQANVLLNLAKACRLVQEIDPDILHVHVVTSYGLAGALTGRHPFVVTAWGGDVLVLPKQSWVYRQLVRFVLRRADLVTSMAEHMTGHLIEQAYAAANKIVTLPFGVDTDVFNLLQRSRRHGDELPLVVSTRRWDYGYDVHLLIQAIPQVLDFYPDTRFVVAGGGPLRRQLEQLATNLGIADHVEFRGDVLHEKMPRLLGEADVFVSTSRSDGNNISLNEAMACGAFPVVTDIPANREWIESGRNGLLFPCRDAKQLAQSIVEAIGQTDWRQSVMAQNWEIVCMRASWTQKMEKMENLYASLVR